VSGYGHASALGATRRPPVERLCSACGAPFSVREAVLSDHRVLCPACMPHDAQHARALATAAVRAAAAGRKARQ
jgi:hypothetical protein